MYSLNIKQLKCFKSIEIPFNNLTVMAGANGVGKSTSIQSLLFLRHTIESCSKMKEQQFSLKPEDWRNEKIPLNENYCLALGNTSHILFRDFQDENIHLSFNFNNQEIRISYQVNTISPDLYISPKETNFANINIDNPILKKEFYYLNAERLGPRIQQSLSHQLFPHAGWQGENTAQLLQKIEFERAFENRNVKERKQKFVKDQLNDWLDELLDGIRVKVTANPDTLSAQILLENNYTVNEPTLATNLGFGVSYLLPIVVNALIAKKGAFLIIENPEAHLHPGAQSKLGKFLAQIASTGVYVVVETHSDHIISGIQIAVAENEIKADDININYFFSSKKNQPEVKPISISDGGELSEWPKGFFDQTQIDYAYLFKLRRK